jgi:hypothetical protein
MELTTINEGSKLENGRNSTNDDGDGGGSI